MTDTQITHDELMALLKRHTQWRHGNPDGQQFNANNLDLTGSDLRRANLTHANLTDANLSGADLTCANLTRTNLTGADLSHADLICANLIGADLTGADLPHADLTDANLSCANLTEANLTGADLSGADLYNTIGNGREICSFKIKPYHITYTNEILHIGCQDHPIDDWWHFTNKQIDKMNGFHDCLAWWKAHKSLIQQRIQDKYHET